MKRQGQITKRVLSKRKKVLLKWTSASEVFFEKTVQARGCHVRLAHVNVLQVTESIEQNFVVEFRWDSAEGNLDDVLQKWRLEETLGDWHIPFDVPQPKHSFPMKKVNLRERRHSLAFHYGHDVEQVEGAAEGCNSVANP